MIDCCVLRHWKIFFMWQNESLFIQEKCCPLMNCLWIMDFQWGCCCILVAKEWTTKFVVCAMFFSSNMPGTSSALTFCMFQLYYQELFSSHFLSQLLSLIYTTLSQNPNFYQFHQFLSSTQSKTYTPTTEYIAAEDCKLPCFKSSWLSRVLSGGHMECLVNLSLLPSHSSSCPSPFKLCTIKSWA